MTRLRYKAILILTGAGVSAESGLGTFRDEDGLWTKYDLNDVATPEGFERNPQLVHEFYNFRRNKMRDAQPNAAHRALALLQQDQRREGGDAVIVTQNIDTLHEQAGAKDVIHMHGELLKSRCELCGDIQEWPRDISSEETCAACGRGGGMRPNVVWFGEMPMEMDLIYNLVGRCDLFVSIGTSGSVYPAAGLVGDARASGAPCIELNLEPSDNHYLFTDSLYGEASEIVPKWVKSIVSA